MLEAKLQCCLDLLCSRIYVLYCSHSSLCKRYISELSSTEITLTSSAACIIHYISTAWSKLTLWELRASLRPTLLVSFIESLKHLSSGSAAISSYSRSLVLQRSTLQCSVYCCLMIPFLFNESTDHITSLCCESNIKKAWKRGWRCISIPCCCLRQHSSDVMS